MKFTIDQDQTEIEISYPENELTLRHKFNRISPTLLHDYYETQPQYYARLGERSIALFNPVDTAVDLYSKTVASGTSIGLQGFRDLSRDELVREDIRYQADGIFGRLGLYEAALDFRTTTTVAYVQTRGLVGPEELFEIYLLLGREVIEFVESATIRKNVFLPGRSPEIQNLRSDPDNAELLESLAPGPHETIIFSRYDSDVKKLLTLFDLAFVGVSDNVKLQNNSIAAGEYLRRAIDPVLKLTVANAILNFFKN